MRKGQGSDEKHRKARAFNPRRPEDGRPTTKPCHGKHMGNEQYGYPNLLRWLVGSPGWMMTIPDMPNSVHSSCAMT